MRDWSQRSIALSKSAEVVLVLHALKNVEMPPCRQMRQASILALSTNLVWITSQSPNKRDWDAGLIDTIVPR
jgi:hypothetical protein